MVATRRGARSEALRVADRVRKAVDEGARTAEEIHKSIAAVPLDMVEGVEALEKTVRGMRKRQQRTIGAVYTAIRRVNHEVNAFAHEMLGRAPARRVPARKTARKRMPAKAKPAAQAAASA
jgi:hypothetical protein